MMEEFQKDIPGFYDDFIAKQAATGTNERIFFLFKKMMQLGLRKNSNVLELGCGIGAFTYMLSKKIKDGIVESVDISPQSILFAKEKIKSGNISFHQADIVSYSPQSKCKFDFITLFDVIEHIPVDQHARLFGNINPIMGEDALLLINIPNPLFIEYDKKYQPEVLQVIDQPIYLNVLSENLYRNNFIIESFQTNSVWFEGDYQFLVIRRKSEFKNTRLSDQRNIFHKLFHRIGLEIKKRHYRYP